MEEGKIRKFVHKVSQISFNGQRAVESGQKVIIVTERAVFELRKEGIVLTEIAGGIDIEKEIFSNMDFRPQIAENVRIMDPRIYQKSPFGLKDILTN